MLRTTHKLRRRALAVITLAAFAAAPTTAAAYPSGPIRGVADYPSGPVRPALVSAAPALEPGAAMLAQTNPIRVAAGTAAHPAI
ncbi:MAG: hypothetical protein JO153_21090 [Solirubrobacterales bacterium]|nr:hypothetical protein [Solirubrobacterales bacterium]MBV9919008.1 hypothetical protein [Solirubrobacterales bacterium]